MHAAGEHDNEPSSSIKDRAFLDQRCSCWFLCEDFASASGVISYVYFAEEIFFFAFVR
jgi:hypothetical protein